MGTWLADLAGILHRVRGLAAPPLPSLGMEPEDGVPLRRRVGAAGIAACVSAVVVNPLDVVKTRIQAQAFNPHVSAATPFRHVAGSGAGAGTARDLPRPLRIALASGCPPRCPTTGNPSVTRRLCAPECNVYASSLDVVRKIVRQEGPLALFRGTAVALAIAVPTVGIYLPCYDICLANARAALAANDATKPWVGVAPALAGAASRTLAVLCVAPLDLARTRAQAFRSGGAKTPTGAVGVRVSAAVSLSSGGVSVGEEDHVRVLLERMGELRFWRLAIKPGKPFTCGQILGTPFAGLPGNPAAVFVTFLVLCRPWLLKMQGASAQRPDLLRVVAGFSLDRAGVRQQYLRARLVATDSGPVAEIYPNQSSGILYSASWGNGMVVIPPGVTVSEGDTVDFLLYEQMLY